jgi:Na+-driven multidrug efflux pump
VYLGVSSGRWLISENKTMLNFHRNLAGMFINVILNMVFIEEYGIVGAAYASLIAYIVAFYLYDILQLETRRIFVMKSKALILKRK